MKYLLVLAVIGIVLWFSLRRGDRAGARRGRRAPPPPQTMVRCVHCGLHLPEREAVADGALRYCTDAHRRLGPRRP